VVAIARVRPAEPEDIAEIARIQRDTWRIAYAELLPAQTLAALDDPELDLAWVQTMETGLARMWVATEAEWTVGFCAAGIAPVVEVADANGDLPPDAPTTALIGTLLVEPRWGRRGHGGRLLATAATTLHTDGATRGITWVPEADHASLSFYIKAGWQPDGTARLLDASGKQLRELRLTGDLDLMPSAPEMG
jgi:GNAT superfamily N-acetyltransferase